MYTSNFSVQICCPIFLCYLNYFVKKLTDEGMLLIKYCERQENDISSTLVIFSFVKNWIKNLI